MSIEFAGRNGQPFRAVEKVDLAVFGRETHGLVGESGSGKTVTALAVLGLIEPPGRVVEGEILWQGSNLLALSEPELNAIRGRGIAMVFQNAPASLNPALRIETQLVGLLRFRRGMDRPQARQQALRLLAAVRLAAPERVLRSYAHELSGGMAQRVALALALSCQPRLLIADEPTSSADVTVAAQLLELFAELRASAGLSILFITHDLGLVARFCDRVSVIQAGRIVEQGPTDGVFRAPQHPYTQALLRSAWLPASLWDQPACGL